MNSIHHRQGIFPAIWELQHRSCGKHILFRFGHQVWLSDIFLMKEVLEYPQEIDG